mmetsp:Transcript_7877/g.29514  ORF Transcript_7877/g.29514 Transcript_7877/m.29514 type:complete len:373 (+) Transcript_7877:3-1121(+)
MTFPSSPAHTKNPSPVATNPRVAPLCEPSAYATIGKPPFSVPSTSNTCTFPEPSPTNATSASGATHREYAKSPSKCVLITRYPLLGSSTVALPSAPAVTTLPFPWTCAISLTAPTPVSVPFEATPTCAATAATGFGWRSSHTRHIPSWPPETRRRLSFPPPPPSGPWIQSNDVTWPSCASRCDTALCATTSHRHTAPSRSPDARESNAYPECLPIRVCSSVPLRSPRVSATARRSVGAVCALSVATQSSAPRFAVGVFELAMFRFALLLPRVELLSGTRQSRIVLSYDALTTKPSSATKSDTEPACPSKSVGVVPDHTHTFPSIPPLTASPPLVTSCVTQVTHSLCPRPSLPPRSTRVFGGNTFAPRVSCGR